MTKRDRRQFLASSVAVSVASLAPQLNFGTPAKSPFRRRSLSSFDRQVREVLRSMTIEEKVGQMTGDRDMEAEGKLDKAEGRARSAVGHAKDAAREIIGKK